ncbi:MAG: hypothetical protein WBN27_06705, partial [Eudoraea sp.]|uniref:hypothetical protein n=1 Tax=Eudoraea sp. TaxID=1979955 RepID=UPI003C75E2C0
LLQLVRRRNTKRGKNNFLIILFFGIQMNAYGRSIKLSQTFDSLADNNRNLTVKPIGMINPCHIFI